MMEYLKRVGDPVDGFIIPSDPGHKPDRRILKYIAAAVVIGLIIYIIFHK